MQKLNVRIVLSNVPKDFTEKRLKQVFRFLITDKQGKAVIGDLAEPFAKHCLFFETVQVVDIEASTDNGTAYVEVSLLDVTNSIDQEQLTGIFRLLLSERKAIAQSEEERLEFPFDRKTFVNFWLQMKVEEVGIQEVR